MAVNGMRRILLYANRSNTLGELRQLLGGDHFELVEHVLERSEHQALSSHQLIVLDGGGGAAALDGCRRLREQLEPLFIPLLYLSDENRPAARAAAIEAGADACLARPFAREELLAQVRALLRIKEVYDRLAGKSEEMLRLNKRLQQLHQQTDQDLQLARRIQSSLLPRNLPEVPHCRFAVHHLSRDRVGGDLYDVFRLDEHHVGLYVADVMGQGVAASLLTIFLKRSLQAKEVSGSDYRLVPPEEVLRRLNKDLLDQHLCEHPFITAAYALYNHRDGVLRFARAGHPCPLYVPQAGETTFLRQEGLMLGVTDTAFPARSYPLKRGDKVLLYSDGIDNGCFEDHSPGRESLLACAALHRHLPIQEFIDRLGVDFFSAGERQDDITLLGLEALS